jgi:lipopolysaccharide biosynthesis glycosyltransferase
VTTLHVACASDIRYAPHSAATLHSVTSHRDGLDVHVHYLHGPSFPESAMALLRRMIEGAGARIDFICIPDQKMAGLARVGHQTPPTWYRIFLPELLPDVDTILYLDCDCIVVDSLAPLWDTDLTGHYLGAVTNVFEPFYLERIEVLGLSAPNAYFNAGVLLLNLDLMRRDNCSQALLEYATSERDRLMWVDQDTLVAVLGGRRLALHPRWNCMNSVMHFAWARDVLGADLVAEARRNPGIRHFEGPPICKPWHYMCEQSMREVYFDHRRETPWPRVQIEGVSARNVASRVVRRARARMARSPVSDGAI